MSLPVLPNWLESVRIKHWFPCGADGRVGGVRSRDYQIFWDGEIYLTMVLRRRASRAKAPLITIAKFGIV